MPIFIFSNYKSMASISCHRNQSSYLIGTKNNINRSPVPIDAICEIWRESASRLQRRCGLKMLTRKTDGRQRRMEGQGMPAYTISSPMSLWLRCAKNGYVNEAIILSKINILASNFFTQMFNVSILCKQSIRLFQQSCGTNWFPRKCTIYA